MSKSQTPRKLARPELPREFAGNLAQFRSFLAAARELGCDEDPEHFDEILKKVARHKPPPDAPTDPKKPKTKKPGL